MAKRGIRLDGFLEDDGLVLLRGFCRAGYTNAEIASKIGTTAETLSRWKARNDQVRQALSNGLDIANFKVEDKLEELIRGFHYEEETWECKRDAEGNPKTDKNGDAIMVLSKRDKKYYRPNFSAIALWLRNKYPTIWRSTDREIKDILTDGTKSAEEKIGEVRRVVITEKEWEKQKK